MSTNWTANAAAVGSEESSEAFTAFLVHLSGHQLLVSNRSLLRDILRAREISRT